MTSVFVVLAAFLVLTIGLLAYAVNRSEGGYAVNRSEGGYAVNRSEGEYTVDHSEGEEAEPKPKFSIRKGLFPSDTTKIDIHSDTKKIDSEAD